MKNKELDLLIVVNMFLTGFDATTLNTLWVDKNLKMHGLIQAYSRTNRILNSIKTFGNIVCFRNLQKKTDEAIALFGDKEASGIVLLKNFKDYFYGYTDKNGNKKPGYIDLINELKLNYPLDEPRIIGEQNQKDFIALFGSILRMRNILSSFDEFEGNDLLEDRDFQNYSGRYLDLRDEWKNRREENEIENINDDVVFEIELLKQIEINIDYILLLVKKYHETHSHEQWPEIIYVGCECAIKLQSDYSKDYLIQKENELKATYQKYLKFASNESWKYGNTSFGNKYLTRKYRGHIFKIWINEGRNFGCSKIKNSRYIKDSYYRESFRTLDEAKRFLFNEFYNNWF